MRREPAGAGHGAAVLRASTVLVFEPEHTGHQPAYVRMLAEWLAGGPGSTRVVFAVSRQLLDRLLREDGLDLERQPGCSAVEIDTLAAESCVSGPLYRRSFARMQLISQLVRRTGADHVVSLFLDPLQLALAFQQRLPGHATLSGILFRPSVHDIYSATDQPTLAERFRDRRKLGLYRMMLRNSSLTAVLSLDPYFPEFAAANMARGNKVRALPDPVVGVPAACDEFAVGPDLRDALRGGLPVFTLFGALSERKGALRLLEALARLPSHELAKMRVVMAGRIEPAIVSEVGERSRALTGRDGVAGSLRIVDRYLTTAELAWLVRHSSVLLAPYQRFVGSSGVLTWAADARKTVIAQNYGLVGALVREYRLGLAVDTSDPEQIAKALQQLTRPGQLECAAAHARWDTFCAGRSAGDFAAAVFGSSPVAVGGPA